MPKYIARRENLYHQTVEVEAENEIEAWEMVQEYDDIQWGDEDFITDSIEIVKEIK